MSERVPAAFAEQRATCLWLAELATWRSGTIAAVVGTFGDLQAAIERPRDEIAARLTRSGRPRRGAREGGDPAAPGDGSAYRTALARCAPDPDVSPPRGGAVVTFVDTDYPPSLRHLHDPPAALFLLGGGDDRETVARLRGLLGAPRVVVVGTRKPSQYGLEMAAGLARDLAEQGCVVVSGLALGVDAAAHRGALEGAPRDAARPATVAVMGCGADICYPAGHRTLRGDVLRCGLVVSEFLWGVSARTWRFPSRNRVMAGLGHGLLLVEGRQFSGALITARHALELGREVLAVPGESGRRTSEAPHVLLHSGAGLCEAGDCAVAALAGVWPSDPDVLWPWSRHILKRRGPDFVRDWWDSDGLAAEAMGRALRDAALGLRPDGPAAADRRRRRGGADEIPALPEGVLEPADRDLPPQERAVLEVVDAGAADLEAVVEASGLATPQALAALGSLETAGRVTALPGGGYGVVRGRRPGGRSRRDE